MNELLCRYFAAHEKLVLPEMGTLVVSSGSAVEDFGTKTIFPPETEIKFVTEEEDSAAVQSFRVYTARFGYSPQDVDMYFHAMKKELKTNGQYLLNGLGIFQEKEGQLSFYSFFSYRQFFPALEEVRPVLRNGSPHVVLVGDNERSSAEMRELLNKEKEPGYWWVYVLVFSLGLAGIGALYYFYFYLRGL